MEFCDGFNLNLLGAQLRQLIVAIYLKCPWIYVRDAIVAQIQLNTTLEM